MSFLYPRTVSFSRPTITPPTQVGDQGYEAQRGAADATPESGDDVALAGLANLKCSIQLDRQGQANPTNLPTDVREALWRIFIPGRSAALGQITEHDIATDDLGKRYDVVSAYWDSLGYQIKARLLEV